MSLGFNQLYTPKVRNLISSNKFEIYIIVNVLNLLDIYTLSFPLSLLTYDVYISCHKIYSGGAKNVHPHREAKAHPGL
jgi:hypothetical protein